MSSATLKDAGLDAPGLHRAATLKAVGDCGLLIEFAAGLDEDVARRVLQLDQSIALADIPGVIENIVAYSSLLVIFDPRVVDYDGLTARMASLASAPPVAKRLARLWRVPVAYGGSFGLDLQEAADRLGLTTAGLVSAHVNAEYTIAMFGFLPGFAYLSGLPPHLALPRRASPRARIFSGSIAIGGGQTAIGSIEGPSGWNVIGRTPLRTFDAERYPATIFEPGDRVRLEPISSERFHDLASRAASGELVAERVA